MTNLSAIKGDIAKAQVDAIVNAANPVMLGGGVDGAIHQAAGPKLLETCKAVDIKDGIRCPAGEARMTDAGKLNTKFVIHTVGPRYNVDPEPKSLLNSTCKNALKLAQENNCKSIAFPAILCGLYAYPIDQAARISIDVCMQKLYRDMKIYFYLYEVKTYDEWQKILNERAIT